MSIREIYIDGDPQDLDKRWGWLEIDDEVVKTYQIPFQAPSHRVTADGRRLNLPSRGRAGRKKFTLLIGQNRINFKTQKILAVKAVCAWAKSWAPDNTQIISPGGYI